MANYKYDNSEWEIRIRKACNDYLSMSLACKSLGMSYAMFKKYAEKFGCWKPNPGRRGMFRSIDEYNKRSISLEEILQGLHPYYPYGALKQRLLKNRVLKNECQICNITEWNGKKIVMHMDHIDGNKRNHRLENLRMICPNCHSQTPTYAGKKRPDMDYRNKLTELQIKNAVESSFTYKEVYCKLNIFNCFGNMRALKKQIRSTPYQLMKKPKQKYEKKKNRWAEEVQRRNIAAIDRNADLVLKVRNSNIDFSKFGWVGKVAQILNKKPQKINMWMKKYVPDIYENAFKRK